MKELKINIPKGYEIDKEKSTFENIVFKEINKLPSSWKNLEHMGGYYVNPGSSTTHYKSSYCIARLKSTFKTREQAEASIALAQLSQLRDVYRQGWEPDWNNEYEEKYCVVFKRNDILVLDYLCLNHFLSFQDKETAELFLENFRDLIDKAKPLMS